MTAIAIAVLAVALAYCVWIYVDIIRVSCDIDQQIAAIHETIDRIESTYQPPKEET